MSESTVSPHRIRWTAIGAAIALTFGGGALGVVRATVSDGQRAVFVPIAPCRLFDTRTGAANVGTRSAPLGPGETFTQPVRGTNGLCTIPGDATAVAMNVTTVNGTAASYLTIYPSDVGQPLASNLNWVAGAPPTPNKVDVGLAADGSIALYNFAGSVDVVADVVGYYSDHNHDDRYYTKAQSDGSYESSVQTVNLGAFSVQPGEGAIGIINGCAGGDLMVALSRVMMMPLPMPVGSRLLSVDVTVLDTHLSVTPYSVDLMQSYRLYINYPSNILASASSAGDGNLVFVDYHLVPSTPYIAGTGDYVTLRLFGTQGLANALCAVRYSYDTRG